MVEYAAYRARADARRAQELAATTSPFTIDVRFLGGLTEGQQQAFRNAADRWTRMIVGDLPSVRVDGEVVDDVLIEAQGVAIDGPGRVLGQAGPTRLRPDATGGAVSLPAKGVMSFDTADLARMEADGTLGDVITHEMGHVLGVGSLWSTRGLARGLGTSNPVFTGPAAVVEYRILRGGSAATNAVPVENTGGPGTRDGHWRESVFGNELMSGFIGQTGNPVSRLTVASLQDLGYQVDIDAAEPYALPDLFSLAEEGELVAHDELVVGGVMLPVIPVTLPEDSLQL